MKRKRKVFISMFIASGFLIYCCATIINFRYICTYQEKAAKDVLLETKVSTINIKNSSETEFCFQLFATLFAHFDEEKYTSSHLISNLSLAFSIPKNWFHKDTRLSASGLPLFYCSLLNNESCSNASTRMFLRNAYPISFKNLPKSVGVLASSTNYSSLDCTLSTVDCNHLVGFVTTWPLLTLKQRQGFKVNDILYLIYSYLQLFSSTNINTNFFCLSLHIIGVSAEPDLLTLLKTKIPLSFQSQANLHQRKKNSSRRRRSALKASPGILYPTEITFPFLPTRITFLPSQVESTPTFLSLSPENDITSRRKANKKSTNVVTEVIATSETQIFPGDLSITKNRATTQELATKDESKEKEDSGSYSGSGTDESGSGFMSSVKSRTNPIHRNVSIISTFHLLFSTALFKNISKSISANRSVSKAFTTDANSGSNKVPSNVKTTPPISNLSYTSFFKTNTSPSNSFIPTRFSGRTRFVAVTTFSTNLSTVESTNGNSNFDIGVTRLISHDLEVKKSTIIADVASPFRDPLSYTLTATYGKIFQFDVPQSWKALLVDPNVKINFSEIVDWLSYEPQQMKIIGVPLNKNKRTFALLISVYAPLSSEKLPRLSLKIEVHSKSILANPSYVVETNFTANAQLFSLYNQSQAQSSKLSHCSALFILKLAKFLTHVEPDDVSVVSALKTGAKLDDRFVRSATISIRWFVEKYTFKTFSKHYKPSILNANNGEVTGEFFFALLPEFILESVNIITPFAKNDESILAIKPDIYPGQHMNLSVAVPIIVVLLFILLATLILILRYRRKKERFGKNVLIDRTYAKRRKPVCLQSELEMYDFHPSKPKIFAEDFEIESKPRNWNETIFNVSGDVAKTESSSDATDSDLFETEWNQFGHRSSGSYSFVNACFIPNDDCNSMNSATHDYKMAVKKGV